MPSYLAEDHPSFFSNTLDLDHDDGPFRLEFGGGKDRVNEVSFTHSRSYNTTHDSFDESSTLSTRDSDVSDNQMPSTEHDRWREDGSGTGTRPASIKSMSDKRNGGPGNDARDTGLRETLPAGGNAFVLPDRSIPHISAASEGRHGLASSASASRFSPGSNAVHPSRSMVDTASYPSSPQWTARSSVPSHAAPQLRASLPIDVIPRQNSPPPSRTSSFAPASPSAEFAHLPRSSPRRFSSPPLHQPGSAPSPPPPTSGHPPPPGSGALKQRHTQVLDVPKPPTQGRVSKDGMDMAQASGRFSPTVASSGTRRASISLGRRPTRSMQSDGPRDEVVIDEETVRWTEAYRQKRASKRRKKEEDDDGRVLVGTKVDESHANWVTAYNMLTGIRVSVSRTNAKIDRELTDEDFEAKQKSTFDITGNELVPSAKYDFKFKDYAPWVFRHLRAAFRLDPADYLMSLTGKYILSELGSPGKSGSFFYFSRDYKYIIKTIHHAEHKFLRKILREYYAHVQENPNTLLSQFYGLHRVKMPYGKKIHFVVMNNLFPPHRDIHTTFDLKGSTVGRETTEDSVGKNPRAPLKDLNWLRRKQNLELGIQKKMLFLEQLRRDVGLLRKLEIMDYSLLVGIHDLSRGNEENLRDKTLQVFNPGGEKTADEDFQPGLLRTPSKMENYRKARELREKVQSQRPVPMGQALNKMPEELDEDHSRRDFIFNQDDGGFRATHEDNEPADEIYYLGVIDCLTHYGMIKKIEHFWKGLSNDRSKISALPPDQYGDRFYSFIQGITKSAEEARREAQRMDMEAMRAEQQLRQSQKLPELPKELPPLPLQHGEGQETEEMQQQRQQHQQQQQQQQKQLEHILTIVEEVGESSSSRDEMGRWDGTSAWAGPRAGAAMAAPSRAPPATAGHGEAFLMPDSSDSGYGDNSNGTLSRDNSLRLVRPVSRESLNKSLPPIPKKDETVDSGIGGIRLVA